MGNVCVAKKDKHLYGPPVRHYSPPQPYRSSATFHHNTRLCSLKDEAKSNVRINYYDVLKKWLANTVKLDVCLESSWNLCKLEDGRLQKELNKVLNGAECSTAKPKSVRSPAGSALRCKHKRDLKRRGTYEESSSSEPKIEQAWDFCRSHIWSVFILWLFWMVFPLVRFWGLSNRLVQFEVSDNMGTKH